MGWRRLMGLKRVACDDDDDDDDVFLAKLQHRNKIYAP
jgi:hypothetical protein